MKTKLLLFLLLFVNYSALLGQIESKIFFENENRSRLLTLPPNTSFESSVEQISKLLKHFEDKLLINSVKENWIIKEDLGNIDYRILLDHLINKYNLVLRNKNDLIIIEEKTETNQLPELNEIYSSRQLKINALLFEANNNELKKRGIEWEGILSKHGMVIGGASNSGSIDNGLANYSLNIQLEGDVGPFSAYSNALFNFLESEDLGEIEAKLSITVKDGEVGIMQVGSDFSIKQKDFAGNVLDEFYPTGTIIKVTPDIFSKDTLNFAQLDLDVERSFVAPNEISTIVKKTNAKSKIILKDGEEKIIAGLLYNHNRKIRTGIPILKDLPWWVLGLRYLTGSDSYENLQKEVILLIRIEVIPSLEEQYE